MLTPSGPQAVPDYTNLWLVDRSRIQLGRIGCRRARYREYHSGPTLYGIRRRAQALPLVTGIHTHNLLAQLLTELAVPKPDEAAVRVLIQNEAAKYQRRVASRGLLELVADEPDAKAELERITAEQSALVEAMGWALALVWLPKLLETWEPVVIEREFLLPLTDEIHLMSRPDVILRRKSDGALAQFEAKTVGGWLYLPAWRRQWEDSAQLMLTKEAVERELGQPVSFAYIFAMDKGKRSAEKKSGIMRQWSPFLYAYHRQPNPPNWDEDWQPKWEWQDSEGNSRRLGKGYERTATFTFDFPGKPAGMSPVEYWMRSLPEETIEEQREILGPFDFLQHSQESILAGVIAEEQEWQQHLWAIYDVGEQVGFEEGHPEFIKALDQHAPQSWNCHAYGKDCQFLPICRREPGWQAPHQDERFELRRPHHEPELEQMKARGIQPPADQDEEEALAEE